MKSFILGWLIFMAAFSKYEYEYIEIINLERKPIVEVRLNGKTAYFLIDTGSDISMLHKGDSQKYGFTLISRKEKSLNAVGVGGKTSDFHATYHVQLELGSTRIVTRYLAYDLSSIVDGIYNNTGIQIAGIIGSDVMKRYGIVIDYKNRQMGIPTKTAKDRKNARDIG